MWQRLLIARREHGPTDRAVQQRTFRSNAREDTDAHEYPEKMLGEALRGHGACDCAISLTSLDTFEKEPLDTDQDAGNDLRNSVSCGATSRAEFTSMQPLCCRSFSDRLKISSKKAEIASRGGSASQRLMRSPTLFSM